MTSVDIKKQLIDFLQTNRIEQKEFAKMIGKSEVTISRWLNSDKKLSDANINAISFIIKIYSANRDLKIEPNAIFCADDEFVSVPLLSVAQAAELSARGAISDLSPNCGDSANFSKGWAKNGDFAVIVSGRSMCPWYPEGTRVLVGRGEIPRTGDRVVCMLSERSEPVFKVYIDLESRFALLSINKDQGTEPIIIDKMDSGAFFWCWPIKASVRDERAIDAAMKHAGVLHFWESMVDELVNK